MYRSIVLNLNLKIVHTIFIPKSDINDNKTKKSKILNKHIQGRNLLEKKEKEERKMPEKVHSANRILPKSLNWSFF